MRAITKSVGLQVQGTNLTIEKIKKKVMTSIVNMEKKFSLRDETSEKKTDESSKVHDGDSFEQEVEQLLRETKTEIGMSTENAKIECPTKPITHAFIYFNDNNERNKYVGSAKKVRKELRGRKIKISRSMDA